MNMSCPSIFFENHVTVSTITSFSGDKFSYLPKGFSTPLPNSGILLAFCIEQPGQMQMKMLAVKSLYLCLQKTSS